MSSFLSRLWKLLCSLKLAVTLAAAATLTAVAGSLAMPSHPGFFGRMDSTILSRWLAGPGVATPQLSWWVWLAGGLILLLGLNTLCCFLDWLRHFRGRWRKSGEYLIHLGFVLVLVAFVWGSLAGARNEDSMFKPGQSKALKTLPGYSLRLDRFRPQFDSRGRPVNIFNTVELRHGPRLVLRKTIKINDPLTYRGLVVISDGVERIPAGFGAVVAGRGLAKLIPGKTFSLGKGKRLQVLKFFPEAAKKPDGRVVNRGDALIDPALELQVTQPNRAPVRGWYFPFEGQATFLTKAGLRLWPTQPVYRLVTLLTINRDPGVDLALVGAFFMLTGVLLALASYYRKRARRDRPDIA